MQIQKITPAGGRGLQEHYSTGIQASWVNAACGLIVDEFMAQRQDIFNVYEIVAINFIRVRTLAWGKLAERIPLSHFTEGITTSDGVRICAGLPLSVSTIRRTLAGLVDKGWVIRSEVRRADGGDEAPEYSLALDRFQIDNEDQVTARAGRIATCVQTVEVSIQEYMSMSRDDAQNISIRSNKDVSAIHNYRKSAARNGADMLKTPRKKTKTPLSEGHPPGCLGDTPNSINYVNTVNNINTINPTAASRQPEGGAQAAIDRIKARNANKRAQAFAKATDAESMRTMKKVDLQRVVDAIISEHYPGSPRLLLTNESFGMIRKRAIEHQVKDIKDMFRFIVGQWDSLAARYNYGIRNAQAKGQTVKAHPLPSAPDAVTLGLKFPWFMRVYSEHLAGQYQDVGRAAAERQVKELERQIQSLTKANASNRAARTRAEERVARRQVEQIRRREPERMDDSDDEPRLGSPAARRYTRTSLGGK